MLKQSLNFKLSQKLSPQQIQLMKMIQLPTQAFEERLKQEIEENPALDTGKEESDDFDDDLENEFDDDGTEKIDTEDINIDDYLSDDEIPTYKTQANNYSSDDEEKQIPYAAGKTFHQSLQEQLDTFSLNDEENSIAEFLVGSIDDSGYIRRDLADLVDDLYNEFVTVGTHKASSIKVAEAAKVIENTQRDLNIALVNELSVIFDRLDIDTLDVLEAAGSKWNFLPFKPGMVGGHCIGVDPYYLTHKAEMVGYNPQVILAGRRINDNMSRYVGKCVIKKMVQNRIDLSSAKIAVLGVTFKENCPDV